MTKSFAAALVAVIGLGLAAPALAAGPPPSIDDIAGATFSVRARGTEYDLSGETFKSDTEIVWTITKTGPATVSFDSVFGGMAFSAHYVDGFLLQAVAFDAGSPPEAASSMFAAVSGQPGKLKLAGVLTVYDVPPGFQVLRVLKVSAKQIP